MAAFSHWFEKFGGTASFHEILKVPFTFVSSLAMFFFFSFNHHYRCVLGEEASHSQPC